MRKPSESERRVGEQKMKMTNEVSLANTQTFVSLSIFS
jgi:hypothetical protein